MPSTNPHIIHIALVGGGTFCKEFLVKSALDYKKELAAKIVAVADPDPEAPGMLQARDMGLRTEKDYRAFYDPSYNIQLIILLTPETEILDDILANKPGDIRLLSYQTFEILWTAISVGDNKLNERAREIETIIDGIQDFILVMTPDMTVVEANQAFVNKMGYTRETVVGRKCYEIYHKIEQPCDSDEIDCPLQDVIRNKRHCRQIQTRLLPNGETRYYEVYIYPLWEKDGKISKFIHISRDITQHKQEEAEITHRLEQMVDDRTRQLQETHQQLLHQDKMASLGKLAASVVHEINNPIAGILNLIMLMKRMIEEGALAEADIAAFVKYLDLMETETRRTSRIVSNLLAFSRQSKMEVKRIDLNQLIEKTVLLNSNLLKIEGAKIVKELNPALPQLIGSEDQLQQVFMNIVSNAIEAIEGAGGGVLHIKTAHHLENGSITATFHDTGIGIPSANLTRLFEPFFTTKKKGKGVGLGLSVAYGIVEEHGGTITVESEISNGTTFLVELPLNPPGPALASDGESHGQH
jgi:two-component system NtrC family sensor kinase